MIPLVKLFWINSTTLVAAVGYTMTGGNRTRTTVAEERRLREEAEHENLELQREIARLKRGSATPSVSSRTAVLETTSRTTLHPLKPPTFEGKTDVQGFLHTFDRVAQHNDWSGEETALQLCLSLRG